MRVKSYPGALFRKLTGVANVKRSTSREFAFYIGTSTKRKAVSFSV
jgi:hypothetical protein